MRVYAHKKDGAFLEFNLTGKGKSGGEGTVYNIGTIAGCVGRFCAKIYHREFLIKHQKEHYAKLLYMVQHRPQTLSDNSGMIQICYPAFLLFDAPHGGNFVGFVMYLALDNSTTLENLTKVISKTYFERRKQLGKLNKLDEDIYIKFPRCQRASDVKDLMNRYKVIHNIASLVSYLHQDGKYVIGDIKPENILMTIRGGISLVDIDSIQIVENGNLLYKNAVSTPDYCPPEFIKHPQNKKDVSYDLFSIAVLFYEILIGVHPYCCSVPGQQYDITALIKNEYFACGKKKKQVKSSSYHSLFGHLPKSIQDLFIRAFDGAPAKRPTAIEWKQAMHCIITSYPSSTKNSPANNKNVKQTAKPIMPTTSSSIYCHICGAKYYSSISRFCSKCGKPRK